MMNLKVKSKLVSMASKVAITGLVALLPSIAHAGGPYKVFGSHYAWLNNFNNSTFGHSFGTGSTASMSFNWNYPNNYNLYGYPAIVRGQHYGWNPTTDTLFPKRVSAISSSNCYFDYSSGGTNMAGDFAYDVFLRGDTAKSSPQLEIMVWGGHNSYPIGSMTAANVVTSGGYTFDLWEGNNAGAGYYVFSFVPRGTVGKGGNLPTSGKLNVNLKPFYNYLAANRGSRFNNNMYVHVIEAGLEVTRGNGWAWIQATLNS